MVFTRIVLPFLFPSCFIAFTTSKISVPTSENLPSFAAPIFITISISSAPLEIAFKDSLILSFVVTAPSGNPTTVQVFTFESDITESTGLVKIGNETVLSKSSSTPKFFLV